MRLTLHINCIFLSIHGTLVDEFQLKTYLEKVTNVRIFRSARRCRSPRFHVLVSIVSTIQTSFLPTARARRPMAHGVQRAPAAAMHTAHAYSHKNEPVVPAKRCARFASLVPRRERKTATRHAGLTRERPADSHAGAQPARAYL